MKYCQSCGTRNDDGAHYCDECGENLKAIESSDSFRIGTGKEEKTSYMIGTILAFVSFFVTMFFPVVRTVRGEKPIGEFLEFSSPTVDEILIDVSFLFYLLSSICVVFMLLRCYQGLQNKSPIPLEQRNKKSVFIYIKEKRYYEAACELSGANSIIILMCALLAYSYSAQTNDSTEMTIGLPLVIIVNLATWIFLVMYKKREK